MPLQIIDGLAVDADRVPPFSHDIVWYCYGRVGNYKAAIVSNRKVSLSISKSVWSRLSRYSIICL